MQATQLLIWHQISFYRIFPLHTNYYFKKNHSCLTLSDSLSLPQIQNASLVCQAQPQISSWSLIAQSTKILLTITSYLGNINGSALTISKQSD